MSGVEVLGVLGALATASQLAEQSLKIISFISDLYTTARDAPESIQKQVVQVEQLLDIARLIENNASLQTDPVISILRSCQQEAQKLLDTLWKVSVAAADGKAKKLWKTLDGIINEKKILGHLGKLEQQKSSLALCIATTDSTLLHTVHLDLVNVKTSIDEFCHELPGIRDTTRNVTTIIGTLPEIVGSISDIKKTLPAIAGNVVTIHDGLAGITMKVTAIHDVLPMIQEAMRRLSMNEQVSKPSQHHTERYYRVPNRRVHGFIGRKDILNEVDHVLSSGSAPRIVVLRGMGGQGKTQIALEYCHRAKEKNFSTIFWVDASSESSLKKSFEVISEDIKPAAMALLDTDSKVDFVMASLSTWPSLWLMVFDNYDDPIAFDSFQDFLPTSEHGSILITTRHADVDALGQDGKAIEVLGLQEKDALELLFRQSVTKELDPDTRHGKYIVERLGYHPLAIAQAGAYIRKRRIALKDFMDHYNRRRKLILEQTPQMSQYRRKLTDADKETSLSVFTTWELSFQQLEIMQTEGDTKVNLLTLFAFFNCKDISERLFKEFSSNKDITDELPSCLDLCVDSFQGSWDSDRFLDILGELRDLSLLQAFAEEADGFRHFSLHPLVKDWIRLRTDKGICQEYSLLATKMLAKLIISYWRTSEFEMSLLAKQEALPHIEIHEENYHDFLRTELVTSFKISVLIDFANSESLFESLYYETGRYKEAESMNRRVTELWETVLGPEHPSTLTSMYNLALILDSQGKYKEAEDIHRRVIELWETTLGPEHPSTIASMCNLASVLNSQGKYKEAESMSQRVTELSETVLGPEHPSTLTSMNNLALVFDMQGKLKEAESMNRRVIELRETVLGLQHPSTLTSMSNLASIFNSQGKFKEAESMNRRVIELWETVLGPEHPSTLTSMNNLALGLNRQGKFKEARDINQRVIELRETVLGLEHPSTLRSIYCYAYLLQGQKEYESASIHYERALLGYQKMLGVDHPSTLACSEHYSLMLEEKTSSSGAS